MTGERWVRDRDHAIWEFDAVGNTSVPMPIEHIRDLLTDAGFQPAAAAAEPVNAVAAEPAPPHADDATADDVLAGNVAVPRPPDGRGARTPRGVLVERAIRLRDTARRSQGFALDLREQAHDQDEAGRRDTERFGETIAAIRRLS